MFIARENEIGELNRLYNKNRFEMVVIYGRRRVGKTSLINEFCKNKESIFYVAIEQNDKLALDSFSEKVLEFFPAARTYIDSFTTWEKAFEYIADEAKDKRVILAIDEYPYMANANASLSSVLQKIIDTKFKESNIFLILCGSSMSFMENQVLGYKSPLYGRRTAQFKIEPFDYYDSSKFFNEYSSEEKLLAYGIAGGIPQYLGNIQKEGDLFDGLLYNFFQKDGHLFEEPSSILKQELREPATYNSIIEAIAIGSTKINEISTKIGEENKKCSKYLKTLIDIHIVKKEFSVGEKQIRKGIYVLADNMFKFWYTFIPSNITNIEAGMGKIVIEKKVKPKINEYMGRVFEDICIQYMIRQNKKLALPFLFDSIGRWWGTNHEMKRQEEIDIVAKANNEYIFGECKWRNEKISVDVLYSLEEKSKLLNCENKYFYIYSKSGFTTGLKELEKNRTDLELVNLSKILNE